ncbi:MAG TPA: hypothetical protein DDZ51_29435 [Planctomycetaceae bacterium]|nr:hypothetical protein [Planctomycetaceae bacterium]
MHVFDYADVADLVDSFCSQIPPLLTEHSVTADLLPRVVGLGEQCQNPFTVAVVGQMRVGKSSLINAILEKDLAETGVTETTATINWIRYGSNSDQVKVHWKDAPAEMISRDHLKQWTGEAANAAKTRFIELFDDADFLKVASIVDTPGLRSVIGDHTDATESFLGLKCDIESRAIGCKADAIVYVLMPVARESDDSFLANFLNQTQLPGTASFNSLVVLHKWETLESDDPVLDSQSKADRIAAELGASVSTVIPVSAPMAWAAKHLADDLWGAIHRIALMDQEGLSKLIRGERRFAREAPDCPVAMATRQELLDSGLPWPSLRTILSIASKARCESKDELRRHIAEVGKVGHLRGELDRRFFSRSRSLKLLSTVAKAWEPCQIAQLRLRNRRTEVGELLASSKEMLSLLQERIKLGDDDLKAVEHYVEKTQEALHREHVSLSGVLKSLSFQTSQLKNVYDDFVADLNGLELIATPKADALAANEKLELQALFGSKGTAASCRLSPFLADGKAPIDCIEIAIGKFSSMHARAKNELKQVLEHGVSRLEQLADHIESELQALNK